ncbi:HEAT repeat domain-containing protein [Mastigocoleus testarum]|uniref:NACHT domain-containing protein n=1 Tax=Mastigocoleus testarum BC008 TaxID=371196 RepID=A0A0V7ZIM9_9CYAN|nr:HEAT repeat domain-containing protein [Mastigocoleus testarum]KST64421.1 hypothetical protein BC008_17465 [Mastigocoleus testarum BC008]
MDPVTAMIGTWVGEFITTETSKILLSGVRSKFNCTDLDKAIKIAVKKACEKENKLFLRCEPDFIKKFINKFCQGKGLEELQKPLRNEGKPDIVFLTKVFTEEALKDSKMKNIAKDCVHPWMETFVNTYFENTDTYLRFQVAKEDYFKQLANWFDDVKFAGIPVAGQETEKSEKLEHIFVMPDVEENVTKQDYSVIANEKELNEIISDHSLGERQKELFLEQRQKALINGYSEKFLATQLLTEKNSKKKNSQKFVLLGAPGSGKTTLLSYFAVMLAQDKAKKAENQEKLGLDPDVDYLPILIRMRDLSRQGNISILDYAKEFAEKTMSVKTLPTGFFEYWLEDGRALILLDGLDEVAEEAKRYDVVRRIENFLGQFQNNLAIITSRPAGYKRDFFRTEEFPHYQLQSFDDEKIEEFIDRWYDSRIQDQAEAERRKDSLRKALNDNERIKLLARNPLLLTIISLIHRYQAILPRERHKLYNKAVETLLTSWDANKELTTHKVLQYLSLDDLRRLMERLAFWIHTQGNTRDNEGGTLIDCEELLDQLKREIKDLKGIELYKAEQEAERFLHLIRDRTGLLNEQGQDCYAFVHKTFQEYLCAEEINYQADNEGDFGIILEQINSNLHDPHWREVLLLLVAQQKPKKAARAIRTILENGSEYEKWLHRDLLFAATCLAEYTNNLNAADPNLGEEILRALVDLEVSGSGRAGEKVIREVFSTLCHFYETAFEEQVLNLLKAEAENIYELRLQEYQAQLGDIEGAVSILIELLNNDNSEMRNSAALTLGNLGEDSQPVVDPLVKLLADDDLLICYSAAQALGKLGKNSQPVVDRLVKLLDNDEHRVRNSAAQALGKLGKDSQPVVDRLIKLLDDSSSRVRNSAAFVLGKLGKDSQPVVDGLLKLLVDGDSRVRNSAAQALGKLGKGSQLVVDRLVKLLNDDNSRVRNKAAFALGYLGQNSQPVVDGLVKLLDDDDSRVRHKAAFALGNLDQNSQPVVDGLVKLLADDNSRVRNKAAVALGNLGKDSQAVVDGLVKLLDDDDSGVRNRVAQALGNLGKGSQLVVGRLVKLLDDDDSGVRNKAAFALGKLGKDSQPVLGGLMKLLVDDDSGVRNKAAFALGKLGKDSQPVLGGLVKLLVDDNSRVRKSAAQALIELHKNSNKVLPQVVQWLEENQDSKFIGSGIDALWDMVTAH